MATTPLMSLSLPSVSSTQGPAWASQLNAALAVVDGHTHVAGSGARVPSAGLNINAALAFNGFDAATVRSLRLVNQSAPLALGTDVGCVYESGGNLYWNSAAGQQVQITAGAALNAASVGAIGGDYATSTASAFYTAASTTFSFWSAANKYASLDAGNVILREPGASSPFGVTLKSPTALAASYALTLPAALPAATGVVTLSSAGVLAASQNLAVGGTLGVVGLATLSGGLTLTGQLTRANLPTVGQQTSGSSGFFSSSSISWVDVTNMGVIVTTGGRPVIVAIQPAPGDAGAYWNAPDFTTNESVSLRVLRDATEVSQFQNANPTLSTGIKHVSAPFSAMVLDAPGAGTHTYKVQMRVNGGGTSTLGTGYVLIVYEL